jgi:hypothetical protein
MSATITFRAKVKTVWHANDPDLAAWRYVDVPALARRHCDMNAFRRHPKYGSYANSDLFPNVLARIRRDVGETIRLDRIPANVTADESGFLAVVVISV